MGYQVEKRVIIKRQMPDGFISINLAHLYCKRSEWMESDLRKVLLERTDLSSVENKDFDYVCRFGSQLFFAKESEVLPYDFDVFRKSERGFYDGDISNEIREQSHKYAIGDCVSFDLKRDGDFDISGIQYRWMITGYVATSSIHRIDARDRFHLRSWLLNHGYVYVVSPIQLSGTFGMGKVANDDELSPYDPVSIRELNTVYKLKKVLNVREEQRQAESVRRFKPGDVVVFKDGIGDSNLSGRIMMISEYIESSKSDWAKTSSDEKRWLFENGYDYFLSTIGEGYGERVENGTAIYAAKDCQIEPFLCDDKHVLRDIDEAKNELEAWINRKPTIIEEKTHKYNIGDPVVLYDGDHTLADSSQLLIVRGFTSEFDLKAAEYHSSKHSRKWYLENGYEYAVSSLSQDFGSAVFAKTFFARESELIPYEGTNMGELYFVFDANKYLLKKKLISKTKRNPHRRRFKPGDAVVFSDDRVFETAKTLNPVRPMCDKVMVISGYVDDPDTKIHREVIDGREWLADQNYDYFLEFLGTGFGVRVRSGYTIQVAKDRQLELYDGDDPDVLRLIAEAREDLRKLRAGEDIGDVAAVTVFSKDGKVYRK